jgi:hypothetical protein
MNSFEKSCFGVPLFHSYMRKTFLRNDVKNKENAQTSYISSISEFSVPYCVEPEPLNSVMILVHGLYLKNIQRYEKERQHTKKPVAGRI